MNTLSMHLFLKRSLFLGFFWVLLGGMAWSDLIVLYDGNGLPNSQPWLNYANNSLLNGGIASISSVPGGARLQSDSAVSGGLGNRNIFGVLKNNSFPLLDFALGVELSFSLGIVSESHQSNNRAGFSVTLIGKDNRGVEIGFWGDRIWAQSSTPLFTQGEGTAVDTSIRRDYRLRMSETNYQLFGGQDLLLDGPLKEYFLFGFPYDLPNFLFLGDNTSQAAAIADLGAITLQTNLTAVPEPSSLFLLSLAGILLCPRFLSAAFNRWRGRKRCFQQI